MAMFKLQRSIDGLFWKGGYKGFSKIGKVFASKKNFILAILNMGHMFFPKYYDDLKEKAGEYIVYEFTDSKVKRYPLSEFLKEYLDSKMQKILNGKMTCSSGYMYCSQCKKITNIWRIRDKQPLCYSCFQKTTKNSNK